MGNAAQIDFNESKYIISSFLNIGGSMTASVFLTPPRVMWETEGLPVAVLVADDRQFEREAMVATITAIFAERKVPLSLIAVETGGNARNALFGEEFNAQSPTRGVVRQAPCKIRLAILDNQMPSREGTPALDNEGIKIAHEFREKLPNSPVSLVATSGDQNQTKFEVDFDCAIPKGSSIALLSQAFEKLGVFELEPAVQKPSKGSEFARSLKNWVFSKASCCVNKMAHKSLE